MKQFKRIKGEKETKMYVNSKHEMYADQAGPVVDDVTAWIEKRLKQKNCFALGNVANKKWKCAFLPRKYQILNRKKIFMYFVVIYLILGLILAKKAGLGGKNFVKMFLLWPIMKLKGLGNK